MTFLSALKRSSLLRATLLSIGPTLIALSACGPDHGFKYPDENSYCRARAQAECSSEVVKACAIVDATHCVANRQTACLAAIAPGVSYNPNGAESCVRAVSAAYSDAKLTAEENRSNGATCAAVFDGPGGANAVCQRNDDCRTSAGLRCVLPGGQAIGTCQVPVSVQGGGNCPQPSQLCVDGFHCGSTFHCDINSQVGEACSDVQPCVSSAICNAAGVCMTKLSDGMKCSSDDQCIHALCARGTGTAEGLCVSQMTLAPNEPFCIDAR